MQILGHLTSLLSISKTWPHYLISDAWPFENHCHRRPMICVLSTLIFGWIIIGIFLVVMCINCSVFFYINLCSPSQAETETESHELSSILCASNDYLDNSIPNSVSYVKEKRICD